MPLILLLDLVLFDGWMNGCEQALIDADMLLASRYVNVPLQVSRIEDKVIILQAKQANGSITVSLFSLYLSICLVPYLLAF